MTCSRLRPVHSVMCTLALLVSSICFSILMCSSGSLVIRRSFVAAKRNFLMENKSVGCLIFRVGNLLDSETHKVSLRTTHTPSFDRGPCVPHCMTSDTAGCKKWGGTFRWVYIDTAGCNKQRAAPFHWWDIAPLFLIISWQTVLRFRNSPLATFCAGCWETLRVTIATKMQKRLVFNSLKRYKSFVEFLATHSWWYLEDLLDGTSGAGGGTLRFPVFSQWDFAGPWIKFIILKGNS